MNQDDIFFQPILRAVHLQAGTFEEIFSLQARMMRTAADLLGPARAAEPVPVETEPRS